VQDFLPKVSKHFTVIFETRQPKVHCVLMYEQRLKTLYWH